MERTAAPAAEIGRAPDGRRGGDLYSHRTGGRARVIFCCRNTPPERCSISALEQPVQALCRDRANRLPGTAHLPRNAPAGARHPLHAGVAVLDPASAADGRPKRLYGERSHDYATCSTCSDAKTAQRPAALSAGDRRRQRASSPNAAVSGDPLSPRPRPGPTLSDQPRGDHAERRHRPGLRQPVCENWRRSAVERVQLPFQYGEISRPKQACRGRQPASSSGGAPLKISTGP